MQGKKIITLNQTCLRLKPSRRILIVNWQHKITNEEVLKCISLTTIYIILGENRFRWIGHFLRISDERIPKNLLYCELVVGKRNVGLPRLRYKDVCKYDLKSLNVGIDASKQLTDNRNK